MLLVYPLLYVPVAVRYVCVRIAQILNCDPAEVLAEIESEAEKTPIKRRFWRDFLLRAKEATTLGTLALIYIVFWPQEAKAAITADTHNV